MEYAKPVTPVLHIEFVKSGNTVRISGAIEGHGFKHQSIATFYDTRFTRSKDYRVTYSTLI